MKPTTTGVSRNNLVFVAVTVAVVLALPFSMRFASARQVSENELTVHEWGTFTSIAGPDGRAINWLPLTASTDLPSFVEHLSNVNNFKGGLRGTIRMETPVLYFYSAHETTVSVRAAFSKGLITEWYPHATVPALDPRKDIALSQKATQGSIAWNSVRIDPLGSSNFAMDTATNHYYAARQTSAAPLTVDGPGGAQHERFLFYRGVSTIDSPLAATVSSNDTVLLQNHLSSQIPGVVLFERRGSKLGYRIVGALTDEASFAAPGLDGSLDALTSDLEGMLIAQGLFAAEAHAMLETWRNSWFEEGSRIFYIVPRAYVDSVLPLTVTPTPTKLTRVFVGRIELATRATQRAVHSAFAANDRATLAKYNRFLEPILEAMIQSSTDSAQRRRLAKYLDSAYSSYYLQARK